MRYVSTRGGDCSLGFTDAVLEGLSRDGGLLVPQSFPDLSAQLGQLKAQTYQDLAARLFRPFIGEEFEEGKVEELIERSYSTFSHREIAPLSFHNGFSLLELYHGPTFAFKDIALQFLGNLFEEILKKKKRDFNILGATSGDTGSAAIQGVKGKVGIRIFMLYPKGRISEIQERQMTSVLEENVVNIAIRGTFDDGQRIVKEIFGDLEFKDRFRLGAVNSINWVRVMAQIVYYFYSAFRFWERYGEKTPLHFSVPTGNFGDIYAGTLARKMGLPIKKLILATNENDILYRVLTTGIYEIGEVTPSLSPAMDIQVASNFERFLFDLLDGNGTVVKSKISDLQQTGRFELNDSQLQKAREVFLPMRVNSEETLSCMRRHASAGLVLDPHTAVGVVAGERSGLERVICLSTAHPAKFGETVERACRTKVVLPAAIAALAHKKTRSVTVRPDRSEIKRIIREHAS